MPNDSSKSDSAESERRHFPRYSFIASAEATNVKTQVRIKARISDLGRWGCYADTISPFEVGTEVRVQITKERLFSAKAKVLYSTVGMGMGLIFTSVDPIELPVLEKWLAELSGESAVEPADESVPVQDHDSPNPQQELRELRRAFNQLIAMLVRKGTLTDSEGKAVQQALSKDLSNI